MTSNTVSLFYWKPNVGDNFGDYLSCVVVERMLERKGLSLGQPAAHDGTGRLLAIGSILHYAQDDDVIWGSGLNGKKRNAKHHRYRRLDVRAVRGPITRQFLLSRGISVPEIYGDPALLLPCLTNDSVPVINKSAVVIVPNLNDLPFCGEDSRIISPLSAWDNILSVIRGAELVVSSSLHALICAEAFEVPARRLILTGQEGDLKFDDYYLGTGRQPPASARSIDEAIEMGGAETAAFDPTQLMQSFPYDLWSDVD